MKNLPFPSKMEGQSRSLAVGLTHWLAVVVFFVTNSVLADVLTTFTNAQEVTIQARACSQNCTNVYRERTAQEGCNSPDPLTHTYMSYSLNYVAPTNGTVSDYEDVNTGQHYIQYCPNANYSGDDYFVFVEDFHCDTSSPTNITRRDFHPVTIHVLPLPPVLIFTNAQQVTILPRACSQNCTNIYRERTVQEGCNSPDPLTHTYVSYSLNYVAPTNGTVSDYGDVNTGQHYIQYCPNANYSGDDYFIFLEEFHCDEQCRTNITRRDIHPVTIHVLPVPPVPTYTDAQVVTFLPNCSQSCTNVYRVLINEQGCPPPPFGPSGFMHYSLNYVAPTNGTVSIYHDTAFNTRYVQYCPNANYSGDDYFVFVEEFHCDVQCSTNITSQNFHPVTVHVQSAGIIINCPADMVVECTGGATPANYTVTASDTNGPVPVTCIPHSGSTFPLGTSSVTCVATNSLGLSNCCTFTVAVVDTTAPSITCSSNIYVRASIPTVVNFHSSASEACSAFLFDCFPFSGSLFPLGTSTVTCSASDLAGNRSSCSFTVTVWPNQCPTAAFDISPVAPFTNQPDLIVIAANNSNACIVLDGSRSSDPDHDALTYLWFEGASLVPFATGVTATNCLAVGIHTNLLRVTDTYGCPASTNVTVEVITPCQAIGLVIEKIENSSLERSQRRPLVASLRAACKSFEDGGLKPGANQLEAFQNKVRAQVVPGDQALADSLTRYVQIIIDAVGGS